MISDYLFLCHYIYGWFSYLLRTVKEQYWLCKSEKYWPQVLRLKPSRIFPKGVSVWNFTSFELNLSENQAYNHLNEQVMMKH